MAAVTCARLEATDPARWVAAALAWRAWAATAGGWVAEFGPHLARLTAAWTGAAATAAAARLTVLRERLTVFRLMCWEVDQVLSEFAAALARAKTLLARAVEAARAAGQVIDDADSAVSAGAPAGTAGAGAAGTTPAGQTAAELARALAMAAKADAAASARLADVMSDSPAEAPPPSATPLPPCAASPAEVRQWWDSLTPQQRRWLVATQAAWLGPLDGIPAGFRDLANRLLLDDRRADLDGLAAGADRHKRGRIADLRRGLDRLTDRLAGGGGPRAYLLRLDLAGEGRAVVALGDPDRAAHVVTQVPGMTADLASYRNELARAERVAVRAAELGPATATSTVTWLDYDAPDFLGEAARPRSAQVGAPALRRFQEGLRATHLGEPAHQTVLGHSYGSLVVGSAARRPGFAADDVMFVGSPGVGVESAADLRVPRDHLWSTTSRTDVIQYAAVSPRTFPEDVAVAGSVPLLGLGLAFGVPERDLWFGHNPSDPEFGARVFPSQAGAGHLGYWNAGGQALDEITAIALGAHR
jgi:alpha/beta hydrolase family protein